MDSPTALRALREYLGVTQEEFGASIGRTRSRIAQLEAGQGMLGKPQIMDLMRKHPVELGRLGITLSDFLTPARGA